MEKKGNDKGETVNRHLRSGVKDGKEVKQAIRNSRRSPFVSCFEFFDTSEGKVGDLFIGPRSDHSLPMSVTH